MPERESPPPDPGLETAAERPEESADDRGEQLRSYEDQLERLPADDAARELIERRVADLRQELGVESQPPHEALERATAAIGEENERARRQLARRVGTPRRVKTLLNAAVGLGFFITPPALAHTPGELGRLATRAQVQTSERTAQPERRGINLEPEKRKLHEEEKSFRTKGIPDHELFRRYAAMEKETLTELLEAGEHQLHRMIEQNAKPVNILEQARENTAIRRAIEAGEGRPWQPGEWLDAHHAFSDEDRAVLAKAVRELRRIYEATVREKGVNHKESKRWLKRMDPWAYLETLTQSGPPVLFEQARAYLADLGGD